jgi:hypothetical protein
MPLKRLEAAIGVCQATNQSGEPCACKSVTGCGAQPNLRRCYPRWLLIAVIGLMLIGNIFNLGADIGAMGLAITVGYLLT